MLFWVLSGFPVLSCFSGSQQQPTLGSCDILRQLSAGQNKITGLHYWCKRKREKEWLESVMGSIPRDVTGTMIRALTMKALPPATALPVERTPSMRVPIVSPAGNAKSTASDIPRDKKKILTDRDQPVTLQGREGSDRLHVTFKKDCSNDAK